MRSALAILAVSCCACASPAAPTAPPVVPTPTAQLAVKGDLDLEDVPGGWMLHGTAVNTGDACAVDITGATVVRWGTASIAYDWSHPLIVKPGGSFVYTFGPLTTEAAQRFGPDGTYTTAFKFRNLPC